MTEETLTFCHISIKRITFLYRLIESLILLKINAFVFMIFLIDKIRQEMRFR